MLNFQAIGFIGSKEPSVDHVETVVERFMTVNDARLSRLREGLPYRQQQCFDALPLLFHVNHPSLPGYLDNQHVPYTLANYLPDTKEQQLAKIVGQGRVPSTFPLRQPDISALYLMGSSGSIGHSVLSDLDIWVCYEPHLTRAQIRLLTQKAELLTQWANLYNLEVHFFLMNSQQFEGSDQRTLTGENCGSTAHVLLLDEFYRTAQLLAGYPPAWWLIPPNKEQNFNATLTELDTQGFIKTKRYTNFGAVSDLPASEFIGAGMWQLYKAIDSPYKSILKLVLLEMYARQFPHISSLAHEYKANIYRMQLSVDDIDPYVMLYRRIEAYLIERNEHERLNLIRRCFYFKVGLRLSKPSRSVHWRRELMSYLVSAWGWTAHDLKHLDNHRLWGVEEVIQERRMIVSELNRSYRFLTEFAAEHQSGHQMSQHDLVILSRKLHTAFDRRPGKIDLLHIGLPIDLSRETLQLHEQAPLDESSQPLWAAYNQAIEEGQPLPVALKHSKGLLETLLWAHINGLISAHLQIPIYTQTQDVTEFELRMTVASLRQHLPSPQPKIEAEAFHHPAHLTRVLIFINLGHDPLKSLSKKGLLKISERSNSLDFSTLRENLIQTLDVVLLNTWGELFVERFVGDDALANALKLLVNHINKQSMKSLPSIETICHNQTRPQAISARVKELTMDALSALCGRETFGESRFAFFLGKRPFLFQPENRGHQFIVFDDENDFSHCLAEAQPTFRPLLFDQTFGESNPVLPKLYEDQSDRSVRVAFEVVDQIAHVQVVDELGSLIEFSQEFFSEASLLAPLVRFLKITEHRQQSRMESRTEVPRKLRCLRITRKQGSIKLASVPLSGVINHGQFISVGVSVDMTSEGALTYQLICGEQEFHSQLLGHTAYEEVARHILSLRHSKDKYPSYITDLSFSETVIENFPFGIDQTCHYLETKRKLETRINAAMAKL